MRFLAPSIEKHPQEVRRATAQLKDILSRDPALDGAVPAEMVRLVPQQRAIWAGQFRGDPAIIKLAMTPDDVAGFVAEWQELARAHRYMAEGAYRVAAPLALGGAGQVMVQGQAAGVPLMDHLWSQEAADRSAWFSRAAQWAQHFAAPTMASNPINRGPWRNWAEAALARQTHPALIEVETRVLQKMKKLSRQLRDHTTWRTAVGHGDLHPNNLIAGDDCLTGIDLGGSNRAPIYKDMARLLTHMARRGMKGSERHRFGMDALAYDAFVQAFALDKAEATLFLPYLICYEVLIRVEHPAMPAARINHAVVMAERLLDDLKQVT